MLFIGISPDKPYKGLYTGLFPAFLFTITSLFFIVFFISSLAFLPLVFTIVYFALLSSSFKISVTLLAIYILIKVLRAL
jgi:hypothetical protein